MNLINLLPGVLKGLWDLGSTYLSNKKEKEQLIHKKELEVIAAQETWDVVNSKGKIATWADEYLLILFSYPLIGLMLSPVIDLFLSDNPYREGQIQEAILEGLVALDSAPDWYVISVMVMVASSFGYKKIVEPFIKRMK